MDHNVPVLTLALKQKHNNKNIFVLTCSHLTYIRKQAYMFNDERQILGLECH